jgi:hypothetical protein
MNTINKRFQIKSYIVALVLTLLASCCPAEEQKSAAVLHAVSYCDLVKSPQSFSGKRIRVRAIYKYGFEIQRLDPPACCSEREVKIWVEIEAGLQGHSLKLFGKLPRGMGLALATFVGTFESGGPYGDSGYRFKFTVDQIENLEGTAKASPSHDPAWVPQKCKKSSIRPQSQLDGRKNAQTKLPRQTHVQARLVEGHFVSEYEMALERIASFIEKHHTFWLKSFDSKRNVDLVFNHAIMSEAENRDKYLEIRFTSAFLALLSTLVAFEMGFDQWGNTRL